MDKAERWLKDVAAEADSLRQLGRAAQRARIVELSAGSDENKKRAGHLVSLLGLPASVAWQPPAGDALAGLQICEAAEAARKVKGNGS
jgi:hypothetical protein